ncbi:MAG: 23S rRNA (guanosine(2251)-2'-O)-methyltransferase RlmB [Ignavibacteriales bacterium]|nr:23S rRNA (guanosine(2251)-2'-O)-methyltransferase RlmB [Ignavibacteriota bacterium]MCB9248152.1 23S rRNA (guanosine(2251)-2'-O)-methyltransferase RlmB [Ignavibacteriales bacterium]
MQKIFGRKPVLEALKSKADIDQIYIQYGLQGSIVDHIKQLAKRNNVKLSQISPQKFNQLTEDKNTQGIIAVKNEFNYSQIDEILIEAEKSEFPLLLLLDSIQDPHNLGAIIRTAECAGANGIIITTKNSASVNNTVEKTSAGATSHIKITQANNLVNTIEILKQSGYWIVGSKLGNSQNYTSIDYKQPIAIVVGNEEKGIRHLVAEKCDFLAEIPMKGKIQSLNVSVATGVLLFEVLRSRSI